MRESNQLRKCKKCGLHFIFNKDSKLPADMMHCPNCRGDNYAGPASLLAKVIEKMMRSQ